MSALRSIFPAASNAVKPQPIRMLRAALRAETSSRARNSRSRASSNPMLRFPARFSFFVARISATVLSITAGSIVAGSFPDKPSSTARSVPCPMPGQSKRTIQVHLHAHQPARVRPSAPAHAQTGTPRASAPSCVNSKAPHQACTDRKDSSSRRRLYSSARMAVRLPS